MVALVIGAEAKDIEPVSAPRHDGGRGVKSAADALPAAEGGAPGAGEVFVVHGVVGTEDEEVEAAWRPGDSGGRGVAAAAEGFPAGG